MLKLKFCSLILEKSAILFLIFGFFGQAHIDTQYDTVSRSFCVLSLINVISSPLLPE